MFSPNPINPSMYNGPEVDSYYGNSVNARSPKKIGGQFEAMFYRMFFQQMQEGELAEPMFDSHAMRQVRSMQFDELSNYLGQQGHLGMGRLIEEEVAKTANLAQDLSSKAAPGLLKPSAKGLQS